MALRLTTSSLTQGPPSAVELQAQANRFLAIGDTAAYRTLFERAAEHEDPNRRYHVQVVLLEQGLGAASQASASRAAEIFLAVAQSGIEVLEQEPREPRILNYVGIAFYELWSLEAARVLFAAALRLDPSIPHTRRNLAEIKRRKKMSRGHVPQVRPMQAALAALARRAKLLAGRAQPATGLTLSLCMIVRDEEEMLPRCLAAIKDAVDEIIIVDTGSTDRTIEIARSFGSTVIEREWTGSFADARNVSFDAATGDWVMYLDADEVLVSEDAERLRSVTGRVWREAFYLVETNYTGEQGDGTALTHNAMRIFRNRPEYRFEGRLHEQIAQKLPGYVPERIEHTSLRIEHYGYLGSVRSSKEKSQRNIELLRAQMSESAPTPFLHFNLGSEYAAAGDAPAALAAFERAWQMIQNEPDGGHYEFTPTLVVRLIKALRACGRGADAIAQADVGLRLFPGFTDLVFEQATASLELRREADAVGYFERCIELGDAPSRYTATRGCGTYLPRLALAEIRLHHGETARARELLDWCLREHPGFYGTVLPYAAALLRSDVAPDAVVAELEERIPEMTPTVRFMLGTALYEAAAAEAAEAQFRLVLERQPHSAQARIALGEALLSQRRYAEAAAEAGQVPADDPLATIACRTELFGSIAAGDRVGVSGARARALEAGLAADEIAVFDAWSELAAGATPLTRLPAGSVALLEVILEALLRVQDFTSFEKLVALLPLTGLPQREQRELLGSLYLRRGFLASAAEEWMAVCEQQPDARALVGLAQVAAAHGLPEDAATFAAQALTLDGSNRIAGALLARYQTAEAA
ncbi:MAG TPA: glycosyltransferase [Solirubrobacteraceae bacterium]|nr:glycosyltransferase [Solirubrobacteraceae bacterium]